MMIWVALALRVDLAAAAAALEKPGKGGVLTGAGRGRALLLESARSQRSASWAPTGHMGDGGTVIPSVCNILL
jgi:hypothetical protein